MSVLSRKRTYLRADARRSSVRIQWKQDERSRLRSVGCVDAGRRADESVTRLADDERRADADDALRLAQDDLDAACSVALFARDLDRERHLVAAGGRHRRIMFRRIADHGDDDDADDDDDDDDENSIDEICAKFVKYYEC